MAKILVIEDEATIRTNLVRVLRFENHEVFAAEDGQLGLLAACSQHPEIILCDIMMPKMDGIAVFEAMRKHPELMGIPFVFLTARADRTEVECKLSSPVDDYLVKPFNLQELLDVVNRNLQKSRECHGLPDSR